MSQYLASITLNNGVIVGGQFQPITTADVTAALGGLPVLAPAGSPGQFQFNSAGAFGGTGLVGYDPANTAGHYAVTITAAGTSSRAILLKAADNGNHILLAFATNNGTVNGSVNSQGDYFGAAFTAGPLGFNTTTFFTPASSGIGATGGLCLTVASGDLTGQTAGQTLATYADNNGGAVVYRVGGYVTITALSLDVLQLRISYTDENGNAQAIALAPQGTASTNLSATGVYLFPSVQIRVQAASTITVAAVLTTGTGSIAYDAGATIECLR